MGTRSIDVFGMFVLVTGVKMLLIDIFKIPVFIALGVVVTLIAASIAASFAWRPKARA